MKLISIKTNYIGIYYLKNKKKCLLINFDYALSTNKQAFKQKAAFLIIYIMRYVLQAPNCRSYY